MLNKMHMEAWKVSIDICYITQMIFIFPWTIWDKSLLYVNPEIDQV